MDILNDAILAEHDACSIRREPLHQRPMPMMPLELVDQHQARRVVLMVLFSRVLNPLLQRFFALGESIARLSRLLRDGSPVAGACASVIQYARS